jgi:hypothetical protein
MKKKFIIMLLLFFCFSQGCAMKSASTININKEGKLKERVEEAYQYFKERKFDKFTDYFEPEISQAPDRQEDISKANKGAAILVNYKIIKIEITDKKAKVNMEASFFEKGKEEKQIHFDYWVFRDNDWFIYDFGKMW